MKKMKKMKMVIALIMAIVLTTTPLYGCGSSNSTEPETTDPGTAAAPEQTDAAATDEVAADPADEVSQDSTAERMSISVAGLSGGMNSFPVYLAEKNGWYDEENLDIEIAYFENGPVQVEAISTWDVSTTGIGGILTAAIVHDAKIIAAECTDNGTQTAYARPDTAIVAAGQGNNTYNSEVYGDAESWKGVQVICSAGTVLQYMLIRILEGFGLTINDVEFISMDTATTNSAFLSGEGDVAVLTGVVSFAADKADYVMVASGKQMETGLDSCVMATADAMANKKAELTAFLKGYFRAVEWIELNKEAAVADLVAYCDESGKSITEDVAKVFLEAEDFYTMEESYQMLTDIAEGSDVNITEHRAAGVLDFFIEAGNYMAGDDELFKGQSTNEFLAAALGK